MNEKLALSRAPRVKGTTGQRKIMIDPQAVEDLAARGLNKEQVAMALGVNFRTLQRRGHDNPAIEEAMLRGRGKGIAKVANALFVMATEQSNVAAAIFWLKNMAGWRDKIEVEHEFILPTPLIIETIKNITPIPEAIETKVIQ